jgi:hypothetical protein
MRVDANVPGYTAWIEFTESWSRADMRRVFDLDGQEFLDFLAGKTTACHLDVVEGDAITVPADISVMANFERLDVRVVQFLSNAITTAAGDALVSARKGFFCVVPSPMPEANQTPAT